ncbi:MAG: hypothetical protein R3F34_16955 [Planctomycetota bacterium]
MPRLVERAEAGKLAVVGPATNRVSLTYVVNAAAAHVDAALALAAGGASAACAGRAYFVNQRDPVFLWEWIARVLTGVGAPPIRRKVSARTAYVAGALCEAAWSVLPLRGEPPMTRFVAQQLALDHTYDLAPAERDFGYRERVPLEEATQRTIEAFRASRAEA